MPSGAVSRITSTGKCFFSSHSTACGASFSFANARAMSRIAIRSSSRANSGINHFLLGLFHRLKGSELGVLNGDAPDALARNDQLHDSRCAVADFEAHHVTHALLVRKVHRPAIVPEGEQTLVDGLERR